MQFGLFHGDPHPGNIFALRDGRIAYVDFGNVAELSQQNKQVLIDAVVHAVNNDYESMANDFIKLVGARLCLPVHHMRRAADSTPTCFHWLLAGPGAGLQQDWAPPTVSSRASQRRSACKGRL